ncbi:MAG: replicative DNA helicase, partial [Lentisphaeria bacterium]|nr:replicative DNA helicase [Lentisphaeria bacterium]
MMKELNRQQAPIDLVTLQAELARKGTLDGVGGTKYLLRILSDVPTAANVQSYINIVLEKSVLRKLIGAARTITQECYTQEKEVQAILTSAEKSIFDIVMNRQEGETLKPMNDVLVNTYEMIEELAKRKGEIAGVPTGFVDLDNMLTGLHPGELIVVGARPA